MKLLTLLLTSALVLLGSASRHFEENLGQAGKDGSHVQFLARDRGRQVFFTANDIVWATPNGPTIRLRFPGAAGKAVWQGEAAPVGLISYAIGNDKSEWVQGARQFERIAWRGVYPGVDALFYWHGDRLEYDLVLAPGADPSVVRVAWSGAKAQLEYDGSIHVAGGAVKQLPPVIYQGSKRVTGSFKSVTGGFRLELGEYDHQRPLIVDPVLELATYIGGENDDAVTALADGLVAGTTASVQFPGARPARRRSRDVFVRGTGSQEQFGAQPIGTLVIGGSGDDELGGAHYMTFGRQVILAGTTRSSDFPSRESTPNRLFGPSDGFLCTVQFDPNSGLSLSSAVLVGGSGEDRINAVSGGTLWYVYAGETTSPDLPNAVGAYAGGTDGFFAHSGSPRLYYLGGKNDDFVRAVGINYYSNFVLGGETRSPDFAYLQPDSAGLRGPSDGFLTTVTLAFGPDPAVPDVISSWLVGGSGEDRINALTPNTFGSNLIQALPLSIAIAGTTTSPDLPVRNAAQPALAGESDAFAGRWRQDAPEWLTYLGGSGFDEATGVARNSTGDLFISGWTRSTDLKTVLPLQEKPGGGEDAFYAVVRPDAVRSFTYFGGAGDDRANGLVLLKEAVARLGGSTTSRDLPVKNPWQEQRGQGSEGFVVDIGLSYLYSVSQVALSKDGAVAIPAKAAQSATGLQITYRSSDPGKVLLTDGVSVAAEITAPLGREVRAEGLTSDGEADILISAPGFESAVCRVKLYPGALIVNYPPSEVSIWSPPLALSSYWSAIDPATNQPLASSAVAPASSGLRTGFRLPPVKWISSDENVLRLVSSYAGGIESIQAVVVGPGETRIRPETAGVPVWPADGTVIRIVRPALTVTGPLRLGKDLQTALPYTLNTPQIAPQQRPGMLTARSEDPSKLLVSSSFSDLGAEVASVPFGSAFGSAPAIWLQALAGDGDVRVVLTSPQLSGEVVVVVRLEPARLRWGAYNPNTLKVESILKLAVGSGEPLTMQLESASGSVASGLRPGVPEPKWRVMNSAATIAETNRLTVLPYSERLGVTGLAVGTATLTLAPLDSSGIDLANPSVRVELVVPPQISGFVPPVSSFVLGKDLLTSISFRYNGPPSAVTVTSEDPSALLVSPSLSQAGQQSLALSPRTFTDEYSFYVHGLRDSGENSIVIKYPGREHKIRVTSAPSGIGLRGAFGAQGFDEGYELNMYALDDLTAVPLELQVPLPGKKFDVTLSTAGPQVRLSSNTATLDNATPLATVSVTLPPPGEAAVLIAESSGRTVRQTLRRVPRPLVSPASIVLMQDTVEPLSLRLNGASFANADLVKVTSSDPEAVLLSLTPAEQGRPSIEFNPARLSGPIYLHGLKRSGSAIVTAESVGFASAETTVVLIPLLVRLISDNSFPVPLLSLAVQQSFVGPARILARALRPGASPIRLRLRSTDSAVVSVSPASLELAGTTVAAQFTLTPNRPGLADLFIESDAGIAVNGSPLAVIVRGGSIVTPAIPQVTIGRNAQLATSFTLNQANPNGAIATIRSSDPSRLLVSRSQTTPGAGTTTVAIQSGDRGGTYYLQALADEGEVTVTAVTPGFADQQWRVRLTPAWFTPRDVRGNGRISIGDSAQVAPALEWADSGNRINSLRPGLGAIQLRFIASDPGAVKLSENTVTVPEGTDLSAATIQVQAVSAGTTMLRVEQPVGFGPVPAGQGQLRLTTPPRALSFSCGTNGALTLGRDSQLSCGLFGVPPGTVIEAVSSDPSRLLLSTDSLSVGSGRQTFTTSATTQLTFQALVASGTEEVVLSSPGFLDLRIPVVLRSLEARPGSGSATIAAGNTENLTVRLLTASPGGGDPATVAARAGSAIRISATPSPAGVFSVEPASVSFAPGSDSVQLMLRGLSPGTALLQLTSPDGLIDPNRATLTVVVR